MAKWGYLKRAYAIKEFAYMRANEAEEEDYSPVVADTLPEVTHDVRFILEMAEDCYISQKETPHEYNTIRQCKRWLKDFAK